ncbi:MAG: hypothetical protein A3D13_05670 [Planctomycetes bacterium RIFCSPHIGHO2_02_FULL_40_12]|nr:MAG: hypothetical protein A3D13_05670 [Planctomycetes bacterium RIFCSPHIGHO2_02_FULL_40_12]OHC01220.1 MAG: hypothetical protein A3H23_10055 [Planctomycetes bacterium RIFCSPLOWO2_12_FULL_40_19]
MQATGIRGRTFPNYIVQLFFLECSNRLPVRVRLPAGTQTGVTALLIRIITPARPGRSDGEYFLFMSKVLNYRRILLVK